MCPPLEGMWLIPSSLVAHFLLREVSTTGSITIVLTVVPVAVFIYGEYVLSATAVAVCRGRGGDDGGGLVVDALCLASVR